jgi:DNA mismatch repair protein MutH
MRKFNTRAELITYTKNIKGKTFKDFDKNGRLEQNLKRNKGVLGQVIEEGFYGYSLNNSAKADFDNLGIELKVTGFIKNKNGTVSAKERLVLSQIDYGNIINEDFNFSKLLFKNKLLLIIWYEYIKNINPADFIIHDFQLYDMEAHGDITIIKNDFEIIKQKVIAGKAHELSEGLTAYLGAATKGRNSLDLVRQPNATVEAMKRAYALKNSYMTGVLRTLNLSFESEALTYKTVEQYVTDRLTKFIGQTQMDIHEQLFNSRYESGVPKNLNKKISDNVLGKDKDLPLKHALFSKTNYIIKNIPVDKKSYPLERMAFRNLVLSEFEEDWIDSTWKNYFDEVTLIVLIYEGSRKIKNGFRVFKGIKQITFNAHDIALFEKTYDMVKKAIEKQDVSKLPYPKSFPNQILEVAPKGQKHDDAYHRFFEKDITRVCFMLDKDFIFKKLIDDN